MTGLRELEHVLLHLFLFLYQVPGLPGCIYWKTGEGYSFALRVV